MMVGRVSPLLRHRRLARGAHRGQRQHLDPGAGEAGAFAGARHHAAEDRFQPVVVAVMELVGLGGGEQDAVDAARHQTGQPVGAAEPEGGEDRGKRGLEVGDRGRSGVQRGQRVDQHDLPVEAGEMVAEERPHDDGADTTRSAAPSCAASVSGRA